MLAHPTQERLLALGLTGMAKALDDQRRQPDIAALAFEERLALLLDRETIERENKRLVARLRFAALRQEAVVEDVDLRAPRGLDRALFQKLAAGDWIDRKQNLLVIGPTGVGKSWIACALAALVAQQLNRDPASTRNEARCCSLVQSGARAVSGEISADNRGFVHLERRARRF